MKFRAFLMFGYSGSGKGTQGQILGKIPGFCHLACGDVFRSLDVSSEVGKSFLQYSSRGELVPDEISIQLWRTYMDKMIALGRFKPDIDHLVLDGIPRNISQAKIMEDSIIVKKVFHLDCRDREALVHRLQKRALKDNRLDDASEEVIRKRLSTYENETFPVLDHYGDDMIVSVDASLYPYQVLREILNHVETQ